jgi:hypothetical protein
MFSVDGILYTLITSHWQSYKRIALKLITYNVRFQLQCMNRHTKIKHPFLISDAYLKFIRLYQIHLTLI